MQSNTFSNALLVSSSIFSLYSGDLHVYDKTQANELLVIHLSLVKLNTKLEHSRLDRSILDLVTIFCSDPYICSNTFISRSPCVLLGICQQSSIVLRLTLRLGVTLSLCLTLYNLETCLTLVLCDLQHVCDSETL